MTAVKARKGRTITVEIDGEKRDYTLKMNFRAICHFEDEAGKSIMAWAATFQSGTQNEIMSKLSSKDILHMVKAALYGGGQELGDDEVCDIIDEIGMVNMMTLSAELLTDALDPGKAGGKAAKTKAPAKK